MGAGLDWTVDAGGLEWSCRATLDQVGRHRALRPARGTRPLPWPLSPIRTPHAGGRRAAGGGQRGEGRGRFHQRERARAVATRTPPVAAKAAAVSTRCWTTVKLPGRAARALWSWRAFSARW